MSVLNSQPANLKTPILSGSAQLFDPFKKLIDEKIFQSMADFGPKTRLRDACQYALLNGGKRFRPAIVFMVADALVKGFDVSDAALAVEYFHCASLIADDLPCMDDDDERREMPSLHKVYGEATSLLVTYALIAAGYERLQTNSENLKTHSKLNHAHADNICVLALANATRNTGILGATGGQYLDIFPPSVNKEVVKEVICCKTVSLFEISFVLGWLYGGGDRTLLEKVKKLSYHFGMAFQVADDIQDLEQDTLNERAINMAALLGRDKSLETVQEEVASYYALLKELHLETPSLQGLGRLVLLHAR